MNEFPTLAKRLGELEYLTMGESSQQPVDDRNNKPNKMALLGLVLCQLLQLNTKPQLIRFENLEERSGSVCLNN